MMALQEERGSSSYSELQKQVSSRTPPQTADSRQPELRWRRLPGQVCSIPNKHVLGFRGGHMGCFSVLFSNAGSILAAACADRDAFPVVVYEIPSGKVLAAFSGHLRIVYDLCWSRDDGRLLSASSDGTVRCWNVEKLLGTAQKVLPHPSFVYCARYHPSAQNLVVTGSFDFLVRVWRLDVSDVNGQLLQEFDGHSSFINSLCFDSAGTRMFSADNSGLIMVWKTAVSHDGPQPSCRHWCLSGECFLGDQVAVYSELGYSSAVHAVAFHPHENMVAFCAFGQGQPVHVYLHDHKVTQLQSLTAASRSASDIRTLRSTPDPPSGMEAATRALKLQSIQQRLDSVLVKAAERFVDVNLDTSKAPPLCSTFLQMAELGPRPFPEKPPCVQVVSLFDYRASRSDELSLRRGDVIQVLHKDNQTWWFGRMRGGLKGYFLSAYVVDQSEALPGSPDELHPAVVGGGQSMNHCSKQRHEELNDE
uniref:Abelson helper integration site 1 n=1 Tax=Oryzias latipes TaxID=8090 RepID=A0A3P9LUG3_ORYLA